MSGGAPGWVSYAALAVSILAVIVALTSARISSLSYRASGPRLSLETTYTKKDPAGRQIVMTFTVTNQGRGDVTIQSFHITPYGNRKPVLEVTEILEGPSLPARLSASARETWTANVLPVAREYDAALRARKIRPNSSWPQLFYFTVLAGNGKRATDRTQFDARQLIADAFPPD